MNVAAQNGRFASASALFTANTTSTFASSSRSAATVAALSRYSNSDHSSTQ
jgi:hypothetical protein